MHSPELNLRPTFIAACLICSIAWCLSVSAQNTGPGFGQANKKQSQPSEAARPEIASPSFRFKLIAGDVDQRIDALMESMTLEEKIGQLVQVYPDGEVISESLREQIKRGQIGSLFYCGDKELVVEAQQLAKSSRLGIPLLIARDVIHGFRTVFPIPLGQAASWNPELVEQAAEVAAEEAKSQGIDWTFAPMVDICRDPRWGRVAETLGEDPLLCGRLSAAMVKGFQQERNGKIEGIAACAKHFVGYGLVEGGRDYNRVSLSNVDLNNLHLPSFKSCVDAGCRTVMTTFSEVNGVPGTASQELIEGVLKNQWQFNGVVVSDWGSVQEMIAHGYSKDDSDAASAALRAGVDMEMCSPTFAENLPQLLAEGKVRQSDIDNAVRRVLRLKVALHSQDPLPRADRLMQKESVSLAREAARQSIVLLKNDGILPLKPKGLSKVAVIGPLADKPTQQLGCWSLDGVAEDTITPLKFLKEYLKDKAVVDYAAGAKNSFDANPSQIEQAVTAAKQADVAIVFIGEDATLSGEARNRSKIDLPGVQKQLLEEVAATKTPTVVVVLSGRPLAIGEQLPLTGAMLYAWHPGTMGGPAIVDVLFGDCNPSGKLPITFPQSAGQVPLYYARHNTGRPVPDDYVPLFQSKLDDLPPEILYRSHYLDITPQPLFPFGFGLSYTTFEYDDIELASDAVSKDGVVSIKVRLTNTGPRAGTEISQVYIRDRFSSVIRPVRELKAFRRTELAAGESTVLEFAIPAAELGHLNSRQERVLESGSFDVWVGGDSTASLHAEFKVLDKANRSVVQD